MQYVTSVGIIASVRHDGTDRPYIQRTFELMLGARDPQDKQLKEAARILRQIGYQARNVQFEPTSGA